MQGLTPWLDIFIRDSLQLMPASIKGLIFFAILNTIEVGGM